MIENNKLTAIQGHLLCCNYSPSFEDFSILTRESNDFKLKIMESVLITRDQSVFNNADSCLSVVIICFITYDFHLSHCVNATVICSVLGIMLQFMHFIKEKMYEHLIPVYA